MFKSIFSKYLATFTVILIACITAILFAVSSRITADSYNIQHETMSGSAGTTALLIDIYLEQEGYNRIYDSFGEKSDLQQIINYSASKVDADIYVFDLGGRLVGTSDETYTTGRFYLSEASLTQMLSTEDSYLISNIDSFFKSNRMNNYQVAYVGPQPFIVLVSMSNYSSVIFSSMIFLTSSAHSSSAL
jgi:hypothetical protein